jgi:hypothetical protein
MRDEQKRKSTDHRDVREILERIVGKLRIEVRIEEQRRAVSRRDRVAVRGRTCGDVRANDGGGARTVVDNDRLSEAFRERRADGSSNPTCAIKRYLSA